MTFTETKVKETVWGDCRVRMYSIANSSTTGTVATGLQIIYGWSISNMSSATGIYATVSGGTLSITTASGDDFYLTVWGK